MGEDRVSNMRLCAPVELMDDRGMTDQRTSLSPHHRAFYGRAVADIEVDPTKCARGVRQLGNIGQIEATALLRRYSISDGRSAKRMHDRKGPEPHAANSYDPS